MCAMWPYNVHVCWSFADHAVDKRQTLHIDNLAVTTFNKIIASNLGNCKDSVAGGCQNDNGSYSGKTEVGSRLLRYLYKYLANRLLNSDI